VAREHTVDELRSILKELRTAIDTLEATSVSDKRHQSVLRKRLKETKMQETVVLAKLAQAGVKV
jgi:hypothetical protein